MSLKNLKKKKVYKDGKTPNINDLKKALQESLTLLSHYATLLNQYDDGKRTIPNSPEEWIERLKEIGII